MTDLSKLSDAELLQLHQQVKKPFEAAAAAEGASGPLLAIARSVYQQESASGKNTKTSNAGAVGGMQIVPATFKGVADEGWDINNPYDNARAGIRYAKQMLDRAGGDAAIAAAGYYGGPGGLDKAKRGIAVSDPRNPSAPNTLEYGRQVASRIPKGAGSQILDKVTDAILPSAQAAEVSPYAAMSDDELMAAYSQAKAGQTVEPVRSSDGSSSVKRSTLDELGRQVGLTVRAGVNGVAALPAMMADAATGPINAGLDVVAGKGNGYRFKPAAKSLDDVLTGIGLPQPENAVERVAQDAASSMAGAGATVKAAGALSRAANSIASSVGGALAAGPGMQVASAAAGAGASGTVRENGGGAVAQTIAGLAGGMAPTVGPYIAQEGVRRAIRGGEAGRLRVVDNIAAFQGASGSMPSVGQAVESRATQGFESTLAKIPGGSGPMSRFAQKQGNDLQASVERLTAELAPEASAVNAGEAIQRGVEAFKTGFRATQKQLYAVLDEHIPADTRVAADRTQAALAALNSDIEGAPALSRWFKNARIQGIEGGLQSDAKGAEAVLTRPGMQEHVNQMRATLDDQAAQAVARNQERQALGMSNLEPVASPTQIDEQVHSFLQSQVDNRLPYESIKKLRTLVGAELENNSLAADVPRSKWRAVYAALSEDLGDAADQAGPKAKTAWTQANDYTALHMKRLDELNSIVSRDAPEKVFQAALSGTAEGDTVISRVMTALPVEDRRQVAASVLQKLGNARPGQQNEMNNAFSSETFLTNLSRLNPSARKVLFDGLGIDDVGKRVETMGKMASNIRKGSKVFANPSGTASAGAQMAGMGALISGNPAAMATALGTAAVANGSARVMTAPWLVKGLAGKTEMHPAAASTTLGSAVRAAIPGPDSPSPEPVKAASPFAHLSDEELLELYRQQKAAAAAPEGEAAPAQVEGPAEAQSAPTPEVAPAPVELTPLEEVTPVSAAPVKAVNVSAAPENSDANAALAPAVSVQQAANSGAINASPQDQTPVAAASPELPREGGAVVPDAGAVVADASPPDRGMAARGQRSAPVRPDPVPEPPPKVVVALTPLERFRAQHQEKLGIKPGDILNRLEKPFTVRLAADRAAKQAGENFEPVKVATGYVVRERQQDAGDAGVDAAAHEAATSPRNDLPEPSDAQREAGNFQKGHLKIAGLDVTIEQPSGSIRKGVAANGEQWERPMRAHYGYIKGSTGADGDQVDVFVGPRPDAANVYVVDQVGSDGSFDEHKALIGYTNRAAAVLAYKAHYPKAFKTGAVTTMPMADFKSWLKEGDLSKPLAA